MVEFIVWLPKTARKTLICNTDLGFIPGEFATPNPNGGQHFEEK